MSDAAASEETLELDEVLEKITFYCFDEAKEKIDAGDECVPFTVVVDGDQMFIESHPGDDVESCRANAMHTVRSSSAFSSHYAFCYDGFLMTDDGQIDAIVVECATNEMEKAYVIALLYREEGENVVYEQQPVFVDEVDTFFDLPTVHATAAERAQAQKVDDEFKQISQ